MSFRIYVTDSLRLMGENKYISVRWYDVVDSPKMADMDGKSIVADIVERAGLVVV